MKSKLLAAIGQHIKSLRRQKALKQNDLAMECDIEKSNMSKIESGKVNVSITMLDRISKGLGVHLREIIPQ